MSIYWHEKAYHAKNKTWTDSFADLGLAETPRDRRGSRPGGSDLWRMATRPRSRVKALRGRRSRSGKTRT